MTVHDAKKPAQWVLLLAAAVVVVGTTHHHQEASVVSFEHIATCGRSWAWQGWTQVP
jgi:hypothetical protein